MEKDLDEALARRIERDRAERLKNVRELRHWPANFQQGAGLVCYYNSTKFHFLQVTADDEGGRQLQVLSALPRDGECGLTAEPVAVPPGPMSLRVEVDHETARFAYRPDGSSEWFWMPETFDASILSDEATIPGLPNFTGTFVGMACYDLTGARMPADFAYFHYVERE